MLTQFARLLFRHENDPQQESGGFGALTGSGCAGTGEGKGLRLKVKGVGRRVQGEGLMDYCAGCKIWSLEFERFGSFRFECFEHRQTPRPSTRFMI